MIDCIQKDQTAFIERAVWSFKVDLEMQPTAEIVGCIIG